MPLATACWLALATAALGRFSPPGSAMGAALALGAVAAGGAWGFRQHRLRLGWSAWDLVALALIGAALVRSWPANTPWPAFLDATWYVNTAARIARDGGLAFRPEALAVADPGARTALAASFADERAVGLPFPDDRTRGFHAVVFAAPGIGAPGIGARGGQAAGARPEVVHPYHPPFFASGLALAARWRGPLRTGEGALPWALAYLLAVAALARAAFGARAPWLAVIVVGAGPAFAYYGANPYAEPAAGALALAGVVCLVRLVDPGGAGGRSDSAHNRSSGTSDTAPGTVAAGGPDGPRPLPALGAGLGLGLAGLAKVDLWPVAVVGALWWWLARRRAGGRREGAALAIGIGLPAAQFALLALGVSNLYVRLNGGGVVGRLRAWAPAVAVVPLIVGLACLVGLRWNRQRSGRDARRAGAVRGARREITVRDARRLIAVLVVLALGAAMVAGWLAPTDEPPSMTMILAWLVTPLGLWAAALGLVLALEGDDPRAGPIIALALTIVPLLLVDPIVSRSLSSLYTARRLVPVALPLVAVLAAAGTLGVADGLAAAWRSGEEGSSPSQRGRGQARQGNQRVEQVGGGQAKDGIGRNQAAAGAALLAGAFGLVVVGLVAAAAPFAGAGGRDFAGGAAMARRLASYGGPGDVLLFASTLDGSHAGRLAAAAWTLEGRPTAVIGSPEPDGAAIAAAVDAWRAEGRRVFLVDDGDRPVLEVRGYTATEAGHESLVTQVLAPSPELPPRLAPLALDFRVSELEPSDR